VAPAGSETVGAGRKFVVGGGQTDQVDGIVEFDRRHQLHQRYVEVERLWRCIQTDTRSQSDCPHLRFITINF